jgi:AcrR family transcriptional regulator
MSSSEQDPGSLGQKKPEKTRARPGRPPKIDTEQLLKIAREVFLERGIRATTAEVAERAGVSEGTLFHRFKTKEALFRQAMQLSEEDLPDLLIGAVDAVRGLPAEEALQRLAEALLDLGKVAVPLMMMSWSNPICGGPSDANVLKFRGFLKHLAAFFEAEMDTGRFRRLDSEVVARTFLGALHHYCMSRIMAQDASWVVPEGMYVRGLVDLVLYGAALPAEAPAASAPYHRR